MPQIHPFATFLRDLNIRIVGVCEKFAVLVHTQDEALTLAEDEDSPLPKLYALLGTAQGLLTRIVSEEQASTARK
jgi:hypothetical protein